MPLCVQRLVIAYLLIVGSLAAQTTFIWSGTGDASAGIADRNNWSTGVLPAGKSD